MKRWIVPAACVVSLIAFARPASAQYHGGGPQAEAFTVDTALATQGKRLFMARGCAGCHTVGKGDLSAPDLGGLFERRSVNWIQKWLRNPTQMLETDETAKELAKRYNNMRMPNLKLSDKEILALMHHIAEQTAATRQAPPPSQ